MIGSEGEGSVESRECGETQVCGTLSLHNHVFLAKTPFTACLPIHPALLNFLSHHPPLRNLHAASQTQISEVQSNVCACVSVCTCVSVRVQVMHEAVAC